MHQKPIPSKRTTRFVFECTQPIRASLTFWWLRKKLSKNFIVLYIFMVLFRNGFEKERPKAQSQKKRN